MFWRPFVILVVCVWCGATAAAAARDVHVVFLNPGKQEADEGWGVNSHFMQAAASQFSIQLEILYADRDRLKMVEQARAVAARPVQPDYVVLVNERQLGVEMLRLFAHSPARLLLIHNDLTEEQRAAVGNERGRLGNWIGTIVTDEQSCAGAMMAELDRRTGAGGQILGISGDPLTPVSHLREVGVRAYLQRGTGHGRQLQVVPGEWSRQDGDDKAMGLLARYPEANVIWAANDMMALGALDAVRRLGRQRQVIVGGLGAFPSALDSIAEGGLTVTVGGHMMVGAWAMVLIHDYDNGRDFAIADGVRMMCDCVTVAAGAGSVSRFHDVIDDPARIDYHRLSLADNPRLGRHDFSYEAMFRAAR